MVPNGYASLDWYNFGFEDGYKVVASGYNNAVTSANNVAFNSNAYPAAIYAAPATTFVFNGADFTAAWNDNLQLTITGLSNGAKLYSTTLTLQVSGPYHLAVNWTGVDSVEFYSFGGTKHEAFTGGWGEHFAVDNVVVNASGPVPEPASWAMMIAGFGLAGATLRRRRMALPA